MNHIQALNRTPEDCMFLVQPRCLLGCNEELGTIGVRSCVGHTDRVRLIMLQSRELILKFLAPDRLAASAITEWIATLEGLARTGMLDVIKRTHLYHKFPYHSVKDSVIVVALLGMSNKILDSLGCSFRKQPNMYVTISGV